MFRHYSNTFRAMGYKDTSEDKVKIMPWISLTRKISCLSNFFQYWSFLSYLSDL